MRLKEYKEEPGMKVWLNEQETQLLLHNTENTEQELAIALAVRSGLRAQEITQVKRNDIKNHDITGPRIRVWEGKGQKYRETPISQQYRYAADAIAESRDLSLDTKIIDKTPRTIQRWVNHAAERCQAETDDEGWNYLGPHDLRRTWGTQLVSEFEVEPGMVMEWGGWSDWDTFREHYLGAYSPEAEKQQREKVDWL